MITRAQIEQRIAQLESEMTRFVEDANRQIAAQQGGIAALRALLAEMDNETAAPDNLANEAIEA